LNGEEAKRAVRQARSVVHDEIKALLGEEAAGQLARSAAAKPHRPAIEDTFAIDLKAAGMPLTERQVTALAIGYLDVIEVYGPSGKLRAPTDARTGLTPVQDAWLEQYARHLTPAQLQVVRNYFVADGEWQRVSGK
jgi:hypothetical protein